MLQHTFCFIHHFVIPETQHGIILPAQPRISRMIVLQVLSMLLTLQFNNQLFFQTHEVHRTGVDGVVAGSSIAFGLDVGDVVGVVAVIDGFGDAPVFPGIALADCVPVAVDGVVAAASDDQIVARSARNEVVARSGDNGVVAIDLDQLAQARAAGALDRRIPWHRSVAASSPPPS